MLKGTTTIGPKPRRRLGESTTTGRDQVFRVAFRRPFERRRRPNRVRDGCARNQHDVGNVPVHEFPPCAGGLIRGVLRIAMVHLLLGRRCRNLLHDGVEGR